MELLLEWLATFLWDMFKGLALAFLANKLETWARDFIKRFANRTIPGYA